MYEIYYNLSEKGRREALKKGLNGEKIQLITIKNLHNEISIDPDLLEVFLDLASIDEYGNAKLFVGDRFYSTCVGYRINKQKHHGDYFVYSVEKDLKDIAFDSIQDPAGLIAWELSRRQATSEEVKSKFLEEAERLNQKELPKKLAYEKQREKIEEAEKQREVERRTAMEKRKQEKAQKLFDATTWSLAYGSDHLKEIVTQGLLQQSWKIYEDERLRADMPGWHYPRELGFDIVDHDDDSLKTALNPTHEQVLWLKTEREKHPDKAIDLVFMVNDDGYEITKQMILTSDFLGKLVFFIPE